MLKKVIAVLAVCSFLLAPAMTIAGQAVTYQTYTPFFVFNETTMYIGNSSSRLSFVTNNNDSINHGIQRIAFDANTYPTWTLQLTRDESTTPVISSDRFIVQLYLDAYRDNVTSMDFTMRFLACTFVDVDGNSHTGILNNNLSYYLDNFDYNNRTYFSTATDKPFNCSSPAVIMNLVYDFSESFSFSKAYIRTQVRQCVFSYPSSSVDMLDAERAEGESYSNSANNTVEDQQDTVNDKFEGVQNGFTSLLSGLTTSSTSVDLFKLPAMYIPATSVTPRISLTEEQSINLNDWVSNIERNAPKLIVVVRYILTIAIFLYAGYEVINVIDILVNGRKINPDKPDGGDDS